MSMEEYAQYRHQLLDQAARYHNIGNRRLRVLHFIQSMAIGGVIVAVVDMAIINLFWVGVVLGLGWTVIGLGAHLLHKKWSKWPWV